MQVIITQTINVDDCIAQEIVFVNSMGIRTEGCCCGHGTEEPSAIIKPSCVNKAKKLGYKPEFNHELGHGGQWSINLKSKCNCKGR